MMTILVHFSNSFILDFKRTQLNLIETNSFNFYEFLNLYIKSKRRNILKSSIKTTIRTSNIIKENVLVFKGQSKPIF